MFSRIRDTVDSVFAWLKWPAAICSVLMLPGVVLATMRLVAEVLRHAPSMLMFLGGAAVYTLIWMALLRRSRFSFFMTLEHELTHILFAILTFHRVTNLRVTMTRGGVMGFRGRGNWLITVAPYFVPLTSLALILVQWLTPQWTDPLTVMVGAGFAYHLTSKAHQTHPGQSDLQKVGILFSWMLLPAAVLYFSAVVVAFALNGAAQVATYSADVWETTRTFAGFWISGTS